MSRGLLPSPLMNPRIDLDHVDGKFTQECERRIAGAEIVEGQRDAERVDPLQRVDRVGHLQRRGLGDLDREAQRVELELAQCPFDFGREGRIAELRRGRG